MKGAMTVIGYRTLRELYGFALKHNSEYSLKETHTLSKSGIVLYILTDGLEKEGLGEWGKLMKKKLDS